MIGIDTKKLTSLLHDAPEGKSVNTDEVNPYLLDHLLPILRSGRCPSISEIDFDEFEAWDLQRLGGYIWDFARASYTMTGITTTVCQTQALVTKERTFF